MKVASTDAGEPLRHDAQHELRYLYANHRPSWTLYGLNGLVWEDGRAWKYNSALLLAPDGAYAGRYDKMHLVPFGEYVPLGEALPFMRCFTPYEGDYSCRLGRDWTRFPLQPGPLQLQRRR